MTAPMPETMSPREKVRKAIIDVMKPHDADVTLGRVDLTADAILEALASSGDHAELAPVAWRWRYKGTNWVFGADKPSWPVDRRGKGTPLAV